jgi:alanine racemase
VLSWCEIDPRALGQNLATFRGRLAPRTTLGCVIKADAYGHGMLVVAGLLREAGVDWFCVNGLDEAVELRRAGHRARILVMGHVELARLEEVVEHELRPVIYNLRTIERLDEVARRAGRVVPVHLKLETGTHRQGVPQAALPEFVRRLRAAGGLVLEGATTHFANIEDTTDHGFAERQLERFTRAANEIEGGGTGRLMRHVACSAATLLFPETHFDLVRIGIALFGLWPSRETRVSCLERGGTAPVLRPVLTWKTRVAQVKDVEEGSFVGYGCTYRTTRPTRIAVLPVGYHEGYDRRLSGVAHVLIRGRRAPLRGRVCMNMCMVDVGDVPGVELEDEVVLLGCQGEESIGAEQLAAWCGTIPYEIVSRIHPALPRRTRESPASDPGA